MARPLPGTPGSSYGSSRGGARGAKVVNRPLTKAEKKQNTAAQTYKTKGTPSPAQAKARAATSERMKKVNRDARRAPYYKAAAGAGLTGAVIGGERKPQKTSNKSVQGAAKKAVRAKAEAAKKKKK